MNSMERPIRLERAVEAWNLLYGDSIGLVDMLRFINGGDHPERPKMEYVKVDGRICVTQGAMDRYRADQVPIKEASVDTSTT